MKLSPYWTSKKGKIMEDVNARMTKAKELSAKAINELIKDGELGEEIVDVSELYIVWFSKTLKNWKALLSTDRKFFPYIEVTYNGEKSETYVDIYKKISNRKYLD